MYQWNVEAGYIVSIVAGVSQGNLTEEAYRQIREILAARPEAPAGFFYRLKEDRTWELWPLPPAAEEEEEPAAMEDYVAALAELGVA